MTVQKYSDTVPAVRESTYIKKAEQVQVSELIDKTVLIKDVKVDKDERGDWADYLMEFDGKALCFITGSGPLKDAAKTIIEKGLLKAGFLLIPKLDTRRSGEKLRYLKHSGSLKNCKEKKNR